MDYSLYASDENQDASASQSDLTEEKNQMKKVVTDESDSNSDSSSSSSGSSSSSSSFSRSSSSASADDSDGQTESDHNVPEKSNEKFVGKNLTVEEARANEMANALSWLTNPEPVDPDGEHNENIEDELSLDLSDQADEIEIEFTPSRKKQLEPKTKKLRDSSPSKNLTVEEARANEMASALTWLTNPEPVETDGVDNENIEDELSLDLSDQADEMEIEFTPSTKKTLEPKTTSPSKNLTPEEARANEMAKALEWFMNAEPVETDGVDNENIEDELSLDLSDQADEMEIEFTPSKIKPLEVKKQQRRDSLPSNGYSSSDSSSSSASDSSSDSSSTSSSVGSRSSSSSSVEADNKEVKQPSSQVSDDPNSGEGKETNDSMKEQQLSTSLLDRLTSSPSSSSYPRGSSLRIKESPGNESDAFYSASSGYDEASSSDAKKSSNRVDHDDEIVADSEEGAGNREPKDTIDITETKKAQSIMSESESVVDTRKRLSYEKPFGQESPKERDSGEQLFSSHQTENDQEEDTFLAEYGTDNVIGKDETLADVGGSEVEIDQIPKSGFDVQELTDDKIEREIERLENEIGRLLKDEGVQSALSRTSSPGDAFNNITNEEGNDIKGGPLSLEEGKKDSEEKTEDVVGRLLESKGGSSAVSKSNSHRDASDGVTVTRDDKIDGLNTPETEFVLEKPTEDTKVDIHDLPEFWVTAVDQGSGKTYYFNSLTQETSWVKPIGESLHLRRQKKESEEKSEDSRLLKSEGGSSALSKSSFLQHPSNKDKDEIDSKVGKGSEHDVDRLLENIEIPGSVSRSSFQGDASSTFNDEDVETGSFYLKEKLIAKREEEVADREARLTRRTIMAVAAIFCFFSSLILILFIDDPLDKF